MKIGVTGHRPNKLNLGYDVHSPGWRPMIEMFKSYLQKKNCRKAYTGMALGVDTAFAKAVLELKEEGYDIELICCIPCRNHSCKWLKESVDLYNNILAQADEVILVTDAEYKPYLMQVRNEYIVDSVDRMIAIWDGTDGGTGNCVKYAWKVGKSIDAVHPGNIGRVDLCI